MTIKTSDIEKTIELLEKINLYAREQHSECLKEYAPFYEKMQVESFELWACLKDELRMRSL